MAGRGPAPQPAHIRRLHGETRPSRARRTLADIPAAELGRAVMPAWLGKVARRFWRETAPELERRGVLTSLDTAGFAALCSNYELYRAASEQIQREGATITGARGSVRAHPAVKIRAQVERDLLQGFRDFGMTPLSRARLPAPAPVAEPDAFESFLGGKTS